MDAAVKDLLSFHDNANQMSVTVIKKYFDSVKCVLKEMNCRNGSIKSSGYEPLCHILCAIQFFIYLHTDTRTTCAAVITDHAFINHPAGHHGNCSAAVLTGCSLMPSSLLYFF